MIVVLPADVLPVSAAAGQRGWKPPPPSSCLGRRAAPHVRDAGPTSSDRSRSSRQNLQDGPRRRRHLVHAEARHGHRASRRQRRRQDDDHRHHHGPRPAHVRPCHRARGRNAEGPLPRLAPDEFRKPLYRSADAAHGAAEHESVRHALWRRRYPRAHREIGAGARPDRSARPPDRTPVRRAKDPGRARQGADQRSGRAVARRADRLARSRHCRLGARPSRELLPRPPRHGAPCLAQHERGRAALRARHHHEARPDRRRRHAGKSCWRAMAGPRSKKSSSTSRAAKASTARRRNDRSRRSACLLPHAATAARPGASPR